MQKCCLTCSRFYCPAHRGTQISMFPSSNPTTPHFTHHCLLTRRRGFTRVTRNIWRDGGSFLYWQDSAKERIYLRRRRKKRESKRRESEDSVSEKKKKKKKKTPTHPSPAEEKEIKKRKRIKEEEKKKKKKEKKKKGKKGGKKKKKKKKKKNPHSIHLRRSRW